MRKVKDMKFVAYFQTKGIDFVEMRRIPSFKDKDREVLVFYYDLTDEEYDKLCTDYFTSEILEYEQNLDCLKMMIFKHTNNKTH